MTGGGGAMVDVVDELSAYYEDLLDGVNASEI